MKLKQWQKQSLADGLDLSKEALSAIAKDMQHIEIKLNREEFDITQDDLNLLSNKILLLSKVYEQMKQVIIASTINRIGG